MGTGKGDTLFIASQIKKKHAERIWIGENSGKARHLEHLEAVSCAHIEDECSTPHNITRSFVRMIEKRRADSFRYARMGQLDPGGKATGFGSAESLITQSLCLLKVCLDIWVYWPRREKSRIQSSPKRVTCQQSSARHQKPLSSSGES